MSHGAEGEGPDVGYGYVGLGVEDAKESWRRI